MRIASSYPIIQTHFGVDVPFQRHIIISTLLHKISITSERLPHFSLYFLLHLSLSAQSLVQQFHVSLPISIRARAMCNGIMQHNTSQVKCYESVRLKSRNYAMSDIFRKIEQNLYNYYHRKLIIKKTSTRTDQSVKIKMELLFKGL